MPSYWRLIRFLKYSAKDVAVKTLLMLAITATYIGQAYVIAKGVSAVFAGKPIGHITVFILAAVGCVMLRGVITPVNESFTKLLGAKIKSKIRDELLEKLYELGPGYQSRRRSGNLNSLMTDGIESMEPFLVSYVPQMLVAFITVASLVIYIATLDVVAAMIILFSVTAAVLGPHLALPVVKKSTVRYWGSYAVLNAQYIDAMQGMTTLKVFNSSGQKGKELGEDAEAFRKDSIRNTAFSLVDSAMIILFMTIGSAVSVAVGAIHTAEGSLAAASLISILFLITECFRPITDLNTYWHASYLGFSVSEGYFSIMDEPVTLIEKEDGIKKTSGYLPGVGFQEVSFTYGEDHHYALNHISIQVDPGETVAVVGKSGSGKSTMVNLLMRFYDADSGIISFDGRDIRDYNLETLRQRIAVVYQDTYLFYGTVAENLRMCRQDATQEELEKAAIAANCHEFIKKLPNGYDTIVGERGATLSGGERQRIAIARAILKDAPFLILDEATSSVDAANERDIQEALERLMQSRTTLIIAHRLSTVQNADRIFVLDRGHVVESGTHQELMSLNGHYTQLIQAQTEEGGEQ